MNLIFCLNALDSCIIFVDEKNNQIWNADAFENEKKRLTENVKKH